MNLCYLLRRYICTFFYWKRLTLIHAQFWSKLLYSGVQKSTHPLKFQVHTITSLKLTESSTERSVPSSKITLHWIRFLFVPLLELFIWPALSVGAGFLAFLPLKNLNMLTGTCKALFLHVHKLRNYFVIWWSYF